MGCDCETERDYDEDYYQCEYCTDMCDVCNRCLDHRCECTKADREVYELRQEVDDLKHRIDVLEKWAKTYYYIIAEKERRGAELDG